MVEDAAESSPLYSSAATDEYKEQLDTAVVMYSTDTEMADGAAGGKRKADEVEIATIVCSPEAIDDPYGEVECGAQGQGVLTDSPAASSDTTPGRPKRVRGAASSPSDDTHFRQAQSTAAPPLTPRAT